ncbi:GGDEF domain-containing protein [Acuticoccus kandeliae]|uniref:GGDEF domain-containing protein n=1 Tax=Acuticoccus kandeliae TaxID=2073160 RepID=UPI000D3E1771|nr:GGDEF domain-containing protein [Acuticoccus kandeliae]
MLDFTSLLLCVSLSAGAGGLILVMSWVSARDDAFLLTCALGALLIATSTVFSAFYVRHHETWIVSLAYLFLLCGLATIYGTAWEVRHRARAWRAIAVAAIIAVGVCVPFHAVGYNGLGFVFGFLAAIVLHALIAYNYWSAREESPLTLTGLAVVYGLVGLTFVPRALLVALDGKIVMDGPPQNWAQTVGLAAVVAAAPVLAALTIVLNQQRLVRVHRAEALTDPLTGLPNRRGLYESVGPIARPASLVLFDIDHFKAINDTHGHAVGDEVIILFSRALHRSLEPHQLLARLGGEEFVLLDWGGDPQRIVAQAETVRAAFAECVTAELALRCTVSGGVASGTVDAGGLSGLLALADRAMYQAKRDGRDRLAVDRPLALAR